MNLTFLIIAGIIIFVTSISLIMKDNNNNNIPDNVDEKIEDIEETINVVKSRAKRVKEEISDVLKSAAEVTNQINDINLAIKGGKRKGRKKKE